LSLNSPDDTLDCLGLYCPQPVIRTAQRVKTMRPGQVLEIIGDDPGIQIDIPAWCISNDHRLLGLEKRDDQFFLYLQVRSAG